MKETFHNPVWWLSAVVVGIVLNVISSYLKTWIDRSLDSRRKNLSERNQKRIEARDAMVAILKGNPYGIIFHLQRATHQRLRGLGYSIVGFIALFSSAVHGGYGSIVTIILGGWCIGIGIAYSRKADDMADEADRSCGDNEFKKTKDEVGDADVGIK